MPAKKLIVSLKRIRKVINELALKGYNSFAIYLHGSKEHKEHGLKDNLALIRAWKYYPRPDKRKS